jgi:hypothetical protein
VIQKYRDEVEDDRKLGRLRVSTRIFCGHLPSSASKGQLCRPAMQDGGAALVGKTEDQSSDRFRGLAGSSLAVLAELDLAVSDMRQALMQTLVERPIWVSGTLPMVNAGKRPVRLIGLNEDVLRGRSEAITHTSTHTSSKREDEP